MPERKYEVLFNGCVEYSTEDRKKAMAVARLFFEPGMDDQITVREWILSSDEVLQ